MRIFNASGNWRPRSTLRSPAITRFDVLPQPEFLVRRFLHPRYWPTWFAFGLQRIGAWLPWPLQHGLGRGVGALAWHLAARRRAIVLQNLAIAFPALSEEERNTLARAHFKELGIGVMTIGFAWWASDARIARRVDIAGLEHLNATADGRPTFLVAGHFTTMDMVARGLCLYADLIALYRPLGLPLVDAITRVGRGRHFDLIDKQDTRGLLQHLRASQRIWIAVDQADTTRTAVSAPFFGTAVPTNTTVSRLTARTDAHVIPIVCTRTRRGRFQITVQPPLDGIGQDVAADAAALNAIVQAQIATAPSQYYWVHRRFRGITDDP